jgi:hypothetical protein
MSIPFHHRVTATIDQTMEATGLGKTKVYELIAAGKFRTTKADKRTLVIVESVIKTLTPSEVPTAA